MKTQQEKKYHFIFSEITREKIKTYQQDLIKGQQKAGFRLQEQLKDKPLTELTTEEFIECLIHSKEPNICAEATKFDASTNWNATEVALLGDIGCVIEAKVYDDGRWTGPKVHKEPLDATLVYVPGALLETNYSSQIHPDYDEAAPEGKISFDQYYSLYERRLLPGLLHANAQAIKEGKELLITIPGIGCGQFAGIFRYGGIVSTFKDVLERLLENHGDKLTQVKAIWYDPFQGLGSKTSVINGIKFHVQPLANGGKPQLCKPKEYHKDYADCHLVSFVAWDALSLPGNEYWIGNRSTDDGVKGAASNTMEVLTGIKGDYDPKTNKFMCSEPNTRNWSIAIKETAENIEVQGQIISYETKDFPSQVQEGTSTPTIPYPNTHQQRATSKAIREAKIQSEATGSTISKKSEEDRVIEKPSPEAPRRSKPSVSASVRGKKEKRTSKPAFFEQVETQIEKGLKKLKDIKEKGKKSHEPTTPFTRNKK